MKKLKSLTVFFLALNDEKSLPELIEKTYKIAPKVALDFEVLIINDGSQDNTAQVIKNLMRRYKNLRLISHKRNLGYGAAVATGFKNAQGEWVFYTDGDGQYDPRELTKLFAKLDKNTDVVNGFKLERKDPWTRRFLGEFYNGVLQKMYRPPITDIDCDFRLIRRSLLKKIALTSTSGAVCLELVVKLKKAGASFAEVGVYHYPRLHGRSQFFKLNHLAKTFIENFMFFVDWARKDL